MTIKRVSHTVIFTLSTLWLFGCTGTTTKHGYVSNENNALQQLADDGNRQAQHRLCYGYSYGKEGLDKDVSKALYWCEIAARSGAPNSITLYAEKLYLGIGTAVNYPAALYLYEKAAKKGHVHAQYIASIFYFRGYGTEPNSEKGMYWLIKAAQQGYEPAVRVLEKLKSVDAIKT